MAGSGTSNEADTPVMSLPVTTAPAQDSLYSTSAEACAEDDDDDDDAASDDEDEDEDEDDADA
jgi:hypothetical protein